MQFKIKDLMEALTGYDISWHLLMKRYKIDKGMAQSALLKLRKGDWKV